MTEVSAVEVPVSVSERCIECGTKIRPRSLRVPDLCVRCGDGELDPVEAARTRGPFWHLPGFYDTVNVADVVPGQGGVEFIRWAEERAARRTR